MSFSERLIQLRQLHKLTQKQLAEILSVTPVTVQRFEYGTARPSLDTLVKIADHFNVSLDYVVGRSSDSHKLP